MFRLSLKPNSGYGMEDIGTVTALCEKCRSSGQSAGPWSRMVYWYVFGNLFGNS